MGRRFCFHKRHGPGIIGGVVLGGAIMAAISPPLQQPLITRSGGKLSMVLPMPGQNIYLPPVCVKCGAPAADKPLVKTFYWHHPAIYLTIFAGLLVYVIVAAIVRKCVRVAVPLCPDHVQKRSVWVHLSWILPLVGVADAFVLPGFHVDPAVGVFLMIGLVFAGLVIWAIVGNPIKVKRIDANHCEFTGFCQTFLDQFPVAAQSMTPLY
jgi:hypothetical protein